MNKQSFMHGAMVLVIASLITKVISMAMKMVLVRALGPEGIGLYKMVYPILIMMLTLSTAGLPTAISKLVAEAVIVGDIQKIRRILRVSTTVITTLAIIITIATLALAPWLSSKILTDTRTYYTVLAMAPTILIISWSSILRGYFQGIQNQTPPSTAWVLETLIRTLITLPLVYVFLPDLATASAAAMIGVLAGELTHLGYLYWQYQRRYKYSVIVPMLATSNRAVREPWSKTLYSLAQIAVPVTLTGIVGSFAYGLEPILVTKALIASGYARGAATTLYGLYSGMAVEILVWPTIFTYSLAVTLVPSISEAIEVKQSHLVKRRLYQAFRFTAIIGLPASVIFTILAREISIALYNQPAAGPMLAMLAPIGFLIYLKSPLSGILQGLNRAGLSMAVSIVGSAIKLTLIWWFASKPEYGITGVIWAVIISNIFIATMYFVLVVRETGFYFNLPDTLKILTATALMMIFLQQAKTATEYLPVVTQVVATSFSSILLYIILLFLLKVVSLHTVERIPKIGPALASVLRYVPFLR